MIPVYRPILHTYTIFGYLNTTANDLKVEDLPTLIESGVGLANSRLASDFTMKRGELRINNIKLSAHSIHTS